MGLLWVQGVGRRESRGGSCSYVMTLRGQTERDMRWRGSVVQG
jgi:hypothetical protein